jgi:hypothetical protein
MILYVYMRKDKRKVIVLEIRNRNTYCKNGYGQMGIER